MELTTRGEATARLRAVFPTPENYPDDGDGWYLAALDDLTRVEKERDEARLLANGLRQDWRESEQRLERAEAALRSVLDEQGDFTDALQEVRDYFASLASVPKYEGYQQEAVRLLSLLENYGDHHAWCNRLTTDGPCDCRYLDEMALARKRVHGLSVPPGEDPAT